MIYDIAFSKCKACDNNIIYIFCNEIVFMYIIEGIRKGYHYRCFYLLPQFLELYFNNYKNIYIYIFFFIYATFVYELFMICAYTQI